VTPFPCIKLFSIFFLFIELVSLQIKGRKRPMIDVEHFKKLELYVTSVKMEGMYEVLETNIEPLFIF
jgi:hypothetical protein